MPQRGGSSAMAGTVLITARRRSVEPFATVIVDLPLARRARILLTVNPAALQTAIALGEEWLGPKSDILKCLRLGVALHHGALPTAYRREVERLLRDGVLKIAISSPTSPRPQPIGDRSRHAFALPSRRENQGLQPKTSWPRRRRLRRCRGPCPLSHLRGREEQEA